jgi:spore germination protein
MSKRYYWLVVLVLLLSGYHCREKRYLPEIGVVRQLGIEIGRDQQLLFTQIFPNVGKGRYREQIIVSEAKLFNDARDKAGHIASLHLRLGKLQQFLLSEQLAGKGITNLLNSFYRDYEPPPQALLVIVNGSPQELLSKAVGFAERSPVFSYVQALIKENYGADLSKLSILEFSVLKFAPGIDPLAPVIKLAADGIRFDGLALFAGDRVVGRFNNTESILVLLMMEQLTEGHYVFQKSNAIDPLHPSQKAVVTNFMKVRRRIRITISQNRPLITLSLRVQGNIEEYIWDALDKPVNEKALEKKLSQTLEHDCLKILRHAQSIGSDPLGFGDLFRMSCYQCWKKYDWKTLYSKAQFKVKIDFKIDHYGIIK